VFLNPETRDSVVKSHYIVKLNIQKLTEENSG